ncbi:MAG: tetratricopeptide repeat protein [bacterium]
MSSARTTTRTDLVYGLCAAYIFLHVLSGQMSGYSLWGVHFLAYSPPLLTTATIVAGVALFFFAFTRSGTSHHGRLVEFLDFWGGGKTVLGKRMIVVVVLAGILFSFPSAVHLLGDGYVHLRQLPTSVQTGTAPLRPEPGTFFLLSLLYSLLSPHGVSPEMTFRVYGLLCGLGYILLSFPVAAELGNNREGRLLAFGLLITASYMQQFAGYVEMYAPVFPVVLLYIYFCLCYLNRGQHLLAAAIVLGISVSFHFLLLTLIPSYIALLFAGRNTDRPVSPFKTLLLLIAVLISGTVTLYATGFDLASYFGELRSSNALPLVGDPDFYQPYRLVSLAHLGDILNLLFLTSPGILCVLPLIHGSESWHDKTIRFMVIAAVFPLLFMSGINPEIGAYRDWDLFSLVALPLTLLTACICLAHLKRSQTVTRIGVILCGSLTIHTCLWIGVNANTRSALNRYEDGLESASLSQHASAYGWESLGVYYQHEANDLERSAAAYDMATRVDNDNPRYWNLAGSQYARLGRYPEAISRLRRAIDIQVNTDPRHLFNLGVIYSRTGDRENALRYIKEAVNLDPRYVEGHHTLGLLYARYGQFDLAVAAFGRAAELRPNNPELLTDYGNALLEIGRRDEAALILDRVRRFQNR